MATTEISFWDTSAIMPLCCIQASSLQARRTRRDFATTYIWWGTAVEIHSGIARLIRFGDLGGRDIGAAFAKWKVFSGQSRIIRPSQRVLEIAVGLPEKHGVRALDAFQLAAALEWCGERPRNRPFITADNRLGQAASDEGFNVISLV